VSPGGNGAPSGRILLRLPSSLHAKLLEEAEREGVSLNQFAVAALAGAVGWRHEAPPRRGMRTGVPRGRLPG
jgi:hypothetical protein